LSLLNDDSSTYLHPATSSLSAIDLSITDPSLFLDFSCSVESNQHGSDHFPIVIHTTHSSPVIDSTWKLSKSDWSTFCQKHIQSWLLALNEDNSDPMADFSSKLYNIALTTIPKSKPHSKKHHTVWFDEDCKTAIKDRKKALHEVKTSPTTENIEKYKITRAKARRIIECTKRSWQTFVS